MFSPRDLNNICKDAFSNKLTFPGSQWTLLSGGHHSTLYVPGAAPVRASQRLRPLLCPSFPSQPSWSGCLSSGRDSCGGLPTCPGPLANVHLLLSFSLLLQRGCSDVQIACIIPALDPSQEQASLLGVVFEALTCGAASCPGLCPPLPLRPAGPGAGGPPTPMPPACPHRSAPSSPARTSGRLPQPRLCPEHLPRPLHWPPIGITHGHAQGLL